MQQPLTFQGLHIRQPLLAFLGFPRLWFKLVSLIGARGEIRTPTPKNWFLRPARLPLRHSRIVWVRAPESHRGLKVMSLSCYYYTSPR